VVRALSRAAQRCLLAAVQPIRHAVPAVEAISARVAGRIACCSGADRWKVEMQLARCGLLPSSRAASSAATRCRAPSRTRMSTWRRWKPLGVLPARCVVIEDTVTGVSAGVAAGCTVWGYSPPEGRPRHAGSVRAAGASLVFADMADLAGMLAVKLRLSAFSYSASSAALP
jgi:beta-phosphoglucomutase-like phosphatase (HAD superfamily)